ncbi:MAG: S24 family peptidase [Candidatus Wallbacteria bacterium]|nr:S24 family peptidase [Candidatus Wallbacteria bacterium]
MKKDSNLKPFYGRRSLVATAVNRRFSRRLLELMKEKGLNQSKLALILCTKQQNISRWIAGETLPRMRMAEKIAGVFNVSVEDLIGNPLTIEADFEIAVLPVLGKIPAGVPLESATDIVGEVEVPKAMLQRYGDVFALMVLGESMTGAGIMPGDVVIVAKNVEIRNGDVAAVKLNDYDTTLKRIIYDEDHVILQAENPKFKPIILSKDKLSEKGFEILGRVVKLVRDF